MVFFLLTNRKLNTQSPISPLQDLRKTKQNKNEKPCRGPRQ